MNYRISIKSETHDLKKFLENLQTKGPMSLAPPVDPQDPSRWLYTVQLPSPCYIKDNPIRVEYPMTEHDWLLFEIGPEQKLILNLELIGYVENWMTRVSRHHPGATFELEDIPVSMHIPIKIFRRGKKTEVPKTRSK